MPTKTVIQNTLKSLNIIDWCDVFSSMTLIVGIIYSPFFFTVGLIMMLVRVLFIGNMKEKIKKLKQSYKILLCLLGIYLLNIVGMLWSSNLQYGLFELNHKMPFLVLPLFCLVISPIKKQFWQVLLFAYIVAITIGVAIGLINYFIDPYADGRFLVPTARNISFAFHLCFAISVMTIAAYKNKEVRKFLTPIIILFTVYIFVASLISGIVTLIILMIFALISIIRKKRKSYSIIAISICAIALVLCGVWLSKQIDNYFTPKQEFALYIKEKTALGNDYIPFDNKFIENGYYVYMYSCPSEVESAWKQRTGLNLTDYCTDNEGLQYYKYNDIIYRYLNSKGLKKDASGVAALTDKDIENIKKGYANVVYAERFSLRPRLYQTFFEFEHYLRSGEVREMSVIQRYFWSKNAINIIKQHILIGCGTGDTRDELTAPIMGKHPELCTTGCNPHNQFLYTFAAFGLLGIMIMLIYILYLPIKLRLFKNLYFCVFFIIAICWMFAESSFESFEGMTFISALMSAFCYNDYFLEQKKKINNQKESLSSTFNANL